MSDSCFKCKILHPLRLSKIAAVLGGVNVRKAKKLLFPKQVGAGLEFYTPASNNEAVFSRVCSQCVDSDLITKRSADVPA